MRLCRLLYEALPEEFAQGYKEDATGWVCHPNSNYLIGPRHLSYCAAPTPDNQIDYLLQFAGSGSRDRIDTLYRSVNGFRILSDRFTMPGVRDARIPNAGLVPSAAVLDVRIFSGYGYPKFAPFNGFLVGKLAVRNDGRDQFIYDILDDRGEVISGYFSEEPDILESHSSFESWIVSRVASAAESFRRFLEEQEGGSG